LAWLQRLLMATALIYRQLRREPIKSCVFCIF
jgi:hypothetical protein